MHMYTYQVAKSKAIEKQWFDAWKDDIKPITFANICNWFTLRTPTLNNNIMGDFSQSAAAVTSYLWCSVDNSVSHGPLWLCYWPVIILHIICNYCTNMITYTKLHCETPPPPLIKKETNHYPTAEWNSQSSLSVLAALANNL